MASMLVGSSFASLLTFFFFFFVFLRVYRFAGGRQPKQPIPPGNSAFFYHGLCVATSAIKAQSTGEFNRFIDSFTVSTHSCKLNICLGGGGFDCIAIYAGTSFVFDVGQQVFTDDMTSG